MSEKTDEKEVLKNEEQTPQSSGMAVNEAEPPQGGAKPNFMNKHVLLIAKSAAMLAVTVFLQWAGLMMFAGVPAPFNVVLSGSLVNLCLYISAATVGLIGGAVVAFLTPLFSVLFGHLAFPWFAPFIGIANYTIVVLMWAYVRYLPKKVWVLAIAIAVISAVKFLAMYAVVLQLAPLLANLKPPQLAALQINYSWPQLIAAAIGGVLSVPVLHGLKRAKLTIG